MSSLVPFLSFTGEDKSMFPDETLPTLDTALWLHGRMVYYKFYEKPQVGNQVIQKSTALPRSCIESSLIQETVRRLKNSHRDISPNERTKILDKLTNKLINSGHSVAETKKILVQGATKYVFLIECSEKDKNDPNYRLLYLGKEYN